MCFPRGHGDHQRDSDSGTGRELTEARTALDNVEEMNPDGGYVYPVTLYPQDWFELLDTSFQPIDLLESPAALSQQLKVLEMQHSNITANLNQFLQVIPNNEEVDSLKSAYDACEEKYKKALADLTENNINATMDMVKTVVDIIATKGIPKSGNLKDVVSESTVARVFGIEIGQVDTVLEKLNTSAENCIKAQNDLVTKAERAVKAGLQYFEKNNQLQLKTMLQPLQQQLSDINDQISQLKAKISLSATMNPDEPKDTNGKATVGTNLQWRRIRCRTVLPRLLSPRSFRRSVNSRPRSRRHPSQAAAYRSSSAVIPATSPIMRPWKRR